MSIELESCRYFDGTVFNGNQNIKMANGRISAIEACNQASNNSNMVVPGLVDLQIYGSGGKLFSAEPSVETLVTIEDELLMQGTTSFLACVATNTDEVVYQCIVAAKELRPFAKNCMGLHLEGPFLNEVRSGAHVKEFIRKANLDEIKALLDLGDGVIKMMTIAPELQHEKVIEYLLNQGVIVSLGHSNATCAEATYAYNMGIQTTTHLFNAMSAIHHREPGIPTAVFNHRKAMASIIADGYHVDFEVIKMSQKLLKDRLFLITDAVATCSTGPYPHSLVDDKFIMRDGTLSGSNLTMLQAVKNCVDYCEIALSDAINMATLYPAKLIHKDKSIGKISIGCDANLLVLDESLNIIDTIFKGNSVSN